MMIRTRILNPILALAALVFIIPVADAQASAQKPASTKYMSSSTKDQAAKEEIKAKEEAPTEAPAEAPAETPVDAPADAPANVPAPATTPADSVVQDQPEQPIE